MIKNLFIVIIFFTMALGSFSNPLTHYDSSFYNTFDTPEKANHGLSQKNFPEFLKKAKELMDNPGRELDLGLRLIHRHFDMPSDWGVVETFIPDFERSGKFAYLATKAPLILKDNEFHHREVDDKKAVPASWVVSEGGYKVFEFSDDACVSSAFQMLQLNSAELEKLSNLILTYRLEDLIAVSIHDRATFRNFKGGMLLEKQYFDASVSMLQQPGEKSPLNITTSWGPERTDNCVTYCATECTPTLFEGHLIRRHSSYHGWKW